jgi:iron-sulfur cluster assembly protein
MEADMLEVTDKAVDFLMNMMEKMEIKPKVRLSRAETCEGDGLELVLDEPHDDDEVIVIQGITFLVARDLYEKAKPILIDFVEYTPGAGFKITSNLKSEGTCCC